MSEPERRKQVAQQCRAVAHMAGAIARVYSDYERLFANDQLDDALDSLVEIKGEDSAELMQILGDILNGMDAATDEDEWMTPVFEAANSMWPRQKVAL